MCQKKKEKKMVCGKIVGAGLTVGLGEAEISMETATIAAYFFFKVGAVHRTAATGGAGGAASAAQLARLSAKVQRAAAARRRRPTVNQISIAASIHQVQGMGLVPSPVPSPSVHYAGLQVRGEAGGPLLRCLWAAQRRAAARGGGSGAGSQRRRGQGGSGGRRRVAG